MNATKGPIVACLGEAIIDLIDDGDGHFTALPGGSPMNVAIACRRLGAPTAFLGRLSGDAMGRRLRRHLDAAGVDMRLVETGDEPTSLALVSLEQGQASYAFYRQGTADVAYDPRPRPRLPATLRTGSFGSLALLAEPSGDAVLDVVRSHPAVRWLLDPNLRAGLTGDLASLRSRLLDWVALPQVVKASSEDLAILGLGEGEAVATWLARGPLAIVVTDGAEGARLHRPGSPPLAVPAAAVQVVDTVAAGDTFSAALLTGWLDIPDLAELSDDGWRALLRRAALAASVTCSRAGADPPSADDLIAAERAERTTATKPPAGR